MTWQNILALLLLVAAAFGIGVGVTHDLGEEAAAVAASDAAESRHVRDSLAAVIHATQAVSDSVAHADSVHTVRLLGRLALDHVAIQSAQAEADSANVLLRSSHTVADSVTLYRDNIVPALQLEVGNLNVALAHADSGRQVNADGWKNAVQRSAQFSALLVQDSVVIRADSVALDRAAKVLPVTTAPLHTLGRIAETAAIGLVTVEACKDHPLSWGCAAGVAVLVPRVKL